MVEPVVMEFPAAYLPAVIFADSATGLIISAENANVMDIVKECLVKVRFSWRQKT